MLNKFTFLIYRKDKCWDLTGNYHHPFNVCINSWYEITKYWCLYFTRDLTSATFCVVGNEISIFNDHAIGLSGFGQCSRDLLWTPTDFITFLMQQTVNFCCSCFFVFCCSVPVMHLIRSNALVQFSNSFVNGVFFFILWKCWLLFDFISPLEMFSNF